MKPLSPALPKWPGLRPGTTFTSRSVWQRAPLCLHSFTDQTKYVRTIQEMRTNSWKKNKKQHTLQPNTEPKFPETHPCFEVGYFCLLLWWEIHTLTLSPTETYSSCCELLHAATHLHRLTSKRSVRDCMCVCVRLSKSSSSLVLQLSQRSSEDRRPLGQLQNNESFKSSHRLLAVENPPLLLPFLLSSSFLTCSPLPQPNDTGVWCRITTPPLQRLVLGNGVMSSTRKRCADEKAERKRGWKMRKG